MHKLRSLSPVIPFTSVPPIQNCCNMYQSIPPASVFNHLFLPIPLLRIYSHVGKALPVSTCLDLLQHLSIFVHLFPPVQMYPICPYFFPSVSIFVLCVPTLRICVPRVVSLLPLESSASMGCLSGVMSLKVHRNSTTMSFSFLMGAMCRRSHNGVPVRQVLVVVELVPAEEGG